MTNIYSHSIICTISEISDIASIDKKEGVFMRKKSIRFGDFIKKIRLKDTRELRQSDVAKELSLSLTVYNDTENNRRMPFDESKMDEFAELFNLSEEDKTQMYDLASYENHEIPVDLEDIFLYEEMGALARIALRESVAGNADEEDWKRFIREIERKKTQQGED